MNLLACFLEEPSAQAMLEGVLPKILPQGVVVQYIVFEGKQDLEKQVGKKLKNWRTPNTGFLIMRDQDAGNCIEIKNNLLQKCKEVNKPESLIRIACRELESFYLGDLEAVEVGLGLSNLSRNQDKKKYRNPDLLTNAKQELKRLTGEIYQEKNGSKAIGKHLKLDDSNRSKSFNVLIQGLKRLLISS